jgi:hypothetical protein
LTMNPSSHLLPHQPDGAIAVPDTGLTSDEARRVSKLNGEPFHRNGERPTPGAWSEWDSSTRVPVPLQRLSHVTTRIWIEAVKRPDGRKHYTIGRRFLRGLTDHHVPLRQLGLLNRKIRSI